MFYFERYDQFHEELTWTIPNRTLNEKVPHRCDVRYHTSTVPLQVSTVPLQVSTVPLQVSTVQLQVSTADKV